MKLSCINVPSSNVKRFAEFYQKVLGALIDESHGGPKRIEIMFGNKDERTVCIVATQDEQYQKTETTACQGFEFDVQDVNAEYERIRALDVEVQEPPKDLPWGYRYFHIKDPDGNGIDLVQAL